MLLADDNPPILARTIAILGGSCQIVGTATNGSLAIEMALALQPDVVVLDISMPGQNGLEVAAALRDRGLAAAIVFISAHDDPEFVDVARLAGGLAYVLKPRLSTDLAAAVIAASQGRPTFGEP